MELNMPRSGVGFTTRFTFGKPKRSNSTLTAWSPVAQTAAICPARKAFHCPIKCPSTEVTPHGSSNFGFPMRDEAPAARMTTPKSSTARPTTSPLSSIVIGGRLTARAQIESTGLLPRHRSGERTKRNDGVREEVTETSDDGAQRYHKLTSGCSKAAK